MKRIDLEHAEQDFQEILNNEEFFKRTKRDRYTIFSTPQDFKCSTEYEGDQVIEVDESPKEQRKSERIAKRKEQTTGDEPTERKVRRKITPHVQTMNELVEKLNSTMTLVNNLTPEEKEKFMMLLKNTAPELHKRLFGIKQTNIAYWLAVLSWFLAAFASCSTLILHTIAAPFPLLPICPPVYSCFADSNTENEPGVCEALIPSRSDLSQIPKLVSKLFDWLNPFLN